MTAEAPHGSWWRRVVGRFQRLIPGRPAPTGAAAGRPGYTVTRWVILRLVGVTYLIAFVSLWSQLDGLVGSTGILPVAEFLDAVRSQLGIERYWAVPTLCWLNASDAFLHGLCSVGVVLAILVILDVAPVLALIGLWVAYLSLVSVGQDFLSFQWDILLLETGFLTIFLAPFRLWPRPRTDPPPRPTVVWLFRWLLFRLMFASGIVKLASRDPVWWDLTALTIHYETQPLPTWIGWYAHQLPVWAHQVSCAVMFGIEILVPFLIFGPRRARSVACAALITFQVLIALTGNYCFFNVLTVILCLALLDDRVWPRGLRRRCEGQGTGGAGRRGWPPRWAVAALTTVVLFVSTVQLGSVLARLFGVGVRWPAPVMTVLQGVRPFRTISSYGLFADMTTERPEIIIEGSRDGRRWVAYEFKYKPGDPTRRPRLVAPHQPRLDWQMWFAALGSYQHNPWFVRLCWQLFQQSPPVLALLETNPFPDEPPRFLRAVVYDYRFTDLATKRAEGTWWRRTPRGLYLPVLSPEMLEFR